MGKARLTAFSDGVIAIIITIMAFQLVLPAGHDWSVVWQMWPKLAAYALSFVYIAVYWNNHHHLFAAVRRIDGRILWANSNLLFWLSLVPAGTGWLGQNFLSPVPTALYGLTLLFPAAAYRLLEMAIIRRRTDHAVLAEVLSNNLKGWVSLGFYSAGVLLAFVLPAASVGFYIAVMAMWFVPDPRIAQIFEDGRVAPD